MCALTSEKCASVCVQFGNPHLNFLSMSLGLAIGSNPFTIYLNVHNYVVLAEHGVGVKFLLVQVTKTLKM